MSAPGGAERQSAAAAIDFLDQSTWGRLGRSRTLADVLPPWLALQCALIDGALDGAVVVEELPGRPEQALWPDDSDVSILGRALAAARSRRRGLVEENRIEGGYTLAYPIVLDDTAIGAVALRLDAAHTDDLQTAMRQLQWGIAWLRERVLADRLAGRLTADDTGRTVLDVLAVALEPEDFESSARAVATDLAERHGCERVAVGIRRDERTSIVAISHSAHFGRDMDLVRLLAEAMDEAIDQRSALSWPPPAASPRLTRAHGALAEAHGAANLLTLPLLLRDRWVGAVTLERRRDRPFEAGTAAALDATVAALAAVFEEKRLNSRPLPAKLAHGLAAEWRRFVGPDHAARKAVAAAAALLAFVFLVWFADYRVTADAVVEGREQRAVVVAFDGFLRTAPVRAGDRVAEGDLLAALDDRDLVLERLKWTTERQRRAFEYEKALADRNRTDTRIAANLMEQADAQIRLVEEQLQRARLTAPFAGLVVSGDHSQSIGAAVQRGQVLFEVAPAEGHRIALAVDETQIADLREGQQGRLVLAALPGESFPVEVTRLTPVAKAEEGRNLFRVEARPLGETAALRPGMRGAAKIEIERRRVLWIWTRGFLEWARLAVWRWSF